MELDEAITMQSALEKLVTVLVDKEKYSHKEVLDLVYACTGARCLTGTEITVSFLKTAPEDLVNG